MIIKYLNQENTDILINGTASMSIAAPGDWASIGDGPTREAVLAWIAAGNIPEPYQPPPTPAITSVSMRRARLALLQAGLLDSVDLTIEAIVDPIEKKSAQIEWEYAQTVNRDSPLITQIATGLNITEQEMDDLFNLANTL